MENLGVEVIFFEDEKHAWLLRLPGMFWHKVYYTFWQQAIRDVFKKLIIEYHPVALQHVNWGTGRVVTSLVGLSIPVIFGPIGGFESGSRLVDQDLGLKHRLGEEFRRFHIWRSARSKALKNMYAQIDLVLACTEESAQQIQKLGAKKVARLTNAGISQAKFEDLQERRRHKKENPSLQLFFASRFVGWKGEEIAIRALAALDDTTTRLVMLGSGKNFPRCQSLAKTLSVEHRIEFISFLQNWEDVWNLYTNSDVYLFPSLHDSGGTGALEAMAAGLPVLCLDLGGPGEYIDDTCGAKVAPSKTSIVIRDMAKCIQELRDNPEQRIAKGNKAAQRCGEKFTWEARGVELLKIIRNVWD